MFISYSESEPVGARLAALAEAVIVEEGLHARKYQRDGEPSMVNVEATGAQSSLRTVDECDLLLSIYIPYHYGGRPVAGQCWEANGRYSMCWLEAEWAWKTGKTVLGFQPQRNWLQKLEPQLQVHASEGYRRLQEQHPQDADPLRAFRSRLEEMNSSNLFASAANFQEQVRSALRTWQASRLQILALEHDTTVALIGRSGLREDMIRDLQEPGCFGVHGPVGIGKTALVESVARELAEQRVFRRVVSIDCRHRSLQQVASVLLARCEIPVETDSLSDLKSSIEERLARSRNLIILDGADSPDLWQLIAGGETTTLLVTKDVKRLNELQIPAERRWRVSALDTERDALDLLKRFVGPKSSKEDTALRALAASLHGWPRAMELAGALVRDDDISEAPVATLLQRLQERGFEALHQGDADETGLRELSHLILERVSEPAREALQSLSTLPGWFQRSSAAIVAECEEAELATRLGPLVRFSLLEVDTSRHRYRVEPVIRQLVRSNPQSHSRQEQAWRRFEAHALALLERLGSQETTAAEATAARELASESDLLLNAVASATKRSPTLTPAQLAGMRSLVRRTDAWRTEVDILSHLIQQGSIEEDGVTQAVLEWKLGSAHSNRGKHALAVRHLERSAAAFAKAADSFGLARALTSMARSQAQQGLHRAAIESLRRAESIERSREPAGFGLGIVLHGLGRSYLASGRHELAIECLTESVELGQFFQDSRHLTQVYCTWAKLYLSRGQHEEALKAYAQAEREAELDHNPRQLALVTIWRADALYESGRHEESVQALRQALAQCESLSDPRILVQALAALGSQLQRMGEHSESRKVYTALVRESSNQEHRLRSLWTWVHSLQEDSSLGDVSEVVDHLLEVDDSLPDSRQKAKVYNLVGGLLRSYGQNADARRLHERAIEVCRAAGDSTGVSICYQELATTLVEEGDIAAALSQIEERLRDKDCQQASRATLLNTLGSLQGRLEMFVEARRALSECIEMEERLSPNSARPAFPLHTLGDLELRAGRVDAALPLLERAEALERQHGLQVGLMKVLHTRSRALLRSRKLLDALGAAQESLRLGKEQHDARHQGQILRTMGLIHEQRSEHSEAERCFEESLQAGRDCANHRHVALMSAKLGQALESRGRRVPAAEHYREGMETARHHGLHREYLFLCRLTALNLADRGEIDASLECLAEGMQRLEQAASISPVRREIEALVDAHASILRDQELSEQEHALWERLILLANQHSDGALCYFATTRSLHLLRDTGETELANEKAGEAIDASCRLGDFDGAQRLADGWAVHLWRSGQQKKALTLLKQTASRLSSLEAPAGPRLRLGLHRARMLRSGGHGPRAAESARTLLEEARQAKLPHLAGQARLLLAQLCLEQGAPEQALTLLNEEIERLGDGEPNESGHMVRLGRTLSELDPERSEEFLRSAHASFLGRGRTGPAVLAAIELAKLTLKSGRASDAESILEAAEALASETGMVDRQAAVWAQLARVRDRLHGPEQALQCYEHCVQLRSQGPDPRLHASALRQLARHCRNRLNQPGLALEHATKAVELQRALGSGSHLSATQIELAAVLKDLHRFDEAEALLRDVMDRSDEEGDLTARSSAMLTLSAVLERNERRTEAQAMLRRAREFLQDKGPTETRLLVLGKLGLALHRARRGREAAKVLRELLELHTETAADVAKTDPTRLKLANALRICGLLPEAVEVASAPHGRLVDSYERSRRARSPLVGNLVRDLTSANTTLANTYLDMNQTEEATRLFLLSDEANASNQQYNPYWSLQGRAKAASKDGDFARSLQLFREAQQRTAQSPSALAIYWQDRGESMATLGRASLALQALDTALELLKAVPDQRAAALTEAFTRGKLATALLINEEWEAATQQADAAVRAAENSRSREARVFAAYRSAIVHLHCQRPEVALPLLEQAIPESLRGIEGVPKISVLLHALAEEACRSLGRGEEAEVYGMTRDEQRRSMEARGVRFLPWELGSELPAAAAEQAPAALESTVPAFEAVAGASPQQAATSPASPAVQATVESLQPTEVQLRLADGRSGTCSARELFLGLEGPLEQCCNIGETFWFGLERSLRAGGPLRLSRTTLFRGVLEGLSGRRIEGKVVQIIDQVWAVVEIAPRTWIRCHLHGDVGWGPTSCFQPLIGSSSSIPLLVRGFEKGFLRASSKEVHREILETKDQVYRARFLRRSPRGALLELSPGVVGECPEDSVLLGERSLARGAEVLVEVEDVDARSLHLRRRSAHERVVRDAIGHPILGTVQRVLEAFAFLELGPGIDGFLHASNLNGRTPPDLREVLTPGQSFPVQIFSVQAKGEKLQVKLRQAAGDSADGPLGGWKDLVDLLPPPEVQVGDVIETAIAARRGHPTP